MRYPSGSGLFPWRESADGVDYWIFVLRVYSGPFGAQLGGIEACMQHI